MLNFFSICLKSILKFVFNYFITHLLLFYYINIMCLNSVANFDLLLYCQLQVVDPKWLTRHEVLDVKWSDKFCFKSPLNPWYCSCSASFPATSLHSSFDSHWFESEWEEDKWWGSATVHHFQATWCLNGDCGWTGLSLSCVVAFLRRHPT